MLPAADPYLSNMFNAPIGTNSVVCCELCQTPKEEVSATCRSKPVTILNCRQVATNLMQWIRERCREPNAVRRRVVSDRGSQLVSHLQLELFREEVTWILLSRQHTCYVFVENVPPSSYVLCPACFPSTPHSLFLPICGEGLTESKRTTFF